MPAPISWAAACELLRNATLVRDDLMDGDRTRRGRHAAWARHGEAQALVAGDLLLMLPFLALHWMETGPGRRWEAARTSARTLAWCASGHGAGQAVELALRGSAEVSWDAYRRIAAGKTGTLSASLSQSERHAVLAAPRSRGKPAFSGWRRRSWRRSARAEWARTRSAMEPDSGARHLPGGGRRRDFLDRTRLCKLCAAAPA